MYIIRSRVTGCVFASTLRYGQARSIGRRLAGSAAIRVFKTEYVRDKPRAKILGPDGRWR